MQQKQYKNTVHKYGISRRVSSSWHKTGMHFVKQGCGKEYTQPLKWWYLHSIFITSVDAKPSFVVRLASIQSVSRSWKNNPEIFQQKLL